MACGAQEEGLDVVVQFRRQAGVSMDGRRGLKKLTVLSKRPKMNTNFVRAEHPHLLPL
jgi:hypothetical protein